MELPCCHIITIYFCIQHYNIYITITITYATVQVEVEIPDSIVDVQVEAYLKIDIKTDVVF